MEVKSTVEEAIGVANEVRGFWAKLFGAKAKPVAQATRKKEKYVAVDETKVMADVVKQLTEFFKLQEQLAALIREEEEKSQTVYDPNANLMEAALNRVMALDQMAKLEVTIRETMVYQSPPEMGALYSKVFEMRDVIHEEQEKARLAEEARERVKKWQRRQQSEKQRLRLAILVAALFLVGYLHLWLQILRLKMTPHF
jgi:ABC-type hemin transport system substrate-binding protein